MELPNLDQIIATWGRQLPADQLRALFLAMEQASDGEFPDPDFHNVLHVALEPVTDSETGQVEPQEAITISTRLGVVLGVWRAFQVVRDAQNGSPEGSEAAADAIDRAIEKLLSEPPPPTMKQVARAHAEAELGLLHAVRDRIASVSDTEELARLIDAYNAIPPVNMDDYDPPPG